MSSEWIVNGVKAPDWAIAVGSTGRNTLAWVGENGFNFWTDQTNCMEHAFCKEQPKDSFTLIDFHPNFLSPTRDAPSPRIAAHEFLERGVKYDTGKVLMGLIPPRAELAMAQVLTFGAQKYGPENWRKVENGQQRYLDALMRHLNSHRSGELVDAETGLSHLAHAMCCMSFLLELQLAGEAVQ